MHADVRVRPAQISDAEVIADFNVRLAWETEHKRLDAATVRKGVEALLADVAKGRYFVAELGDRVIGQCCVTYEWSDWRNGNFWWLQSVYVEAAWRSRGVFRSLFDHVWRIALDEGVVGLRLYVEQDNLQAQAAYGRRGMTRTPYLVFERERN